MLLFVSDSVLADAGDDGHDAAGGASAAEGAGGVCIQLPVSVPFGVALHGMKVLPGIFQLSGIGWRSMQPIM